MITRTVGAVAAAVIVAGCGGSSSGRQTGSAVTGTTSHEMHGTVIVPGITVKDRAIKGDTCVPQTGYSDVTAGAAVTVKDQQGTIIGTGRLGHGTFTVNGAATDADPTAKMQAACGMDFTATVPDDASFYSVALGHRGDQTYSRAELAAKGWRIQLRVGG